MSYITSMLFYDNYDKKKKIFDPKKRVLKGKRLLFIVYLIKYSEFLVRGVNIMIRV